MSFSRDIAQANTYASAYNVLLFQILAVSVAVGAYAPSWWWGLLVPILFAALGLIGFVRFLIVISLSGFWALIAQQIAEELGAGYWSFGVALIAFTIAYGINAAGMIGFQHSIPDL